MRRTNPFFMELLTTHVHSEARTYDKGSESRIGFILKRCGKPTRFINHQIIQPTRHMHSTPCRKQLQLCSRSLGNTDLCMPPPQKKKKKVSPANTTPATITSSTRFLKMFQLSGGATARINKTNKQPGNAAHLGSD